MVIKVSVHQENIKVFYFYADNSINSNTLKNKKMTRLQRETNKSTIVVWDFKSPAKDWMFQSPQIILTSNEMVLGSGTSGRWFSLEDGDIMSGINTLLKIPQRATYLSTNWEHSIKIALYKTGSHQTLNLLVTWC